MKATDMIVLGGVAVGGYMAWKFIESMKLDPTGFLKGATDPGGVAQGVGETFMSLITGNLTPAIPGISAEADRLKQTLAVSIVKFVDPALHEGYQADVQAYTQALATNDARINEYINKYEQVTGDRLETPEEIYSRMTPQQRTDAGIDKLYPDLPTEQETVWGFGQLTSLIGGLFK